MGRLDSSSEKNSLCRIVLPVAWRLAGRVKLNPKKSVSDLGLGFVTIAKRRTYYCDTNDRQPTGSALSPGTVYRRKEDFARVLPLSTDHLTRR